MSTTATRSKDTTTDARVGEGRHEARGDHHPRLGCRPREGVLWAARVAARRRLHQRRRPRGPVHASGLPVLHSLRQERHVVPPGSAQGLFLIVSDIQAAREDLVRRGVEVSEVFHYAGWNRVASGGRVSGPAPDHLSYGSYATFSDPDGNGWLLQEITTRLPGPCEPATRRTRRRRTWRSALRRAAAAHGEHEKRTGQRDAELARLVRRVHGGGAGRRRVAAVKESGRPRA